MATMLILIWSLGFAAGVVVVHRRCEGVDKVGHSYADQYLGIPASSEGVRY